MTRKKIVDEFTDRTDVTQQRRYQLRHERDGLCQLCSRPQDPGSSRLCAVHLEKQRARAGTRPWIPGGPGRQPKKIKEEV